MKPREILHKICDHCSEPFPTVQGNARWCGKECRAAARYTENRNPYRKRAATTGKPCDECGRDRGPNYKICQKCVKATRGRYDPLTEYATW